MATIAELLESRHRTPDDTPHVRPDDLTSRPFAGLSASKLREMAWKTSTMSPDELVLIKRRLNTVPTLSNDSMSRESIRRTQLFIIEKPALDYALDKILMGRVKPRQLLAVPRTFLMAMPPGSSPFERAPLKRIDLIEQPSRTIDLVWCDTPFKKPMAVAMLHSKDAVSSLLDSTNLEQQDRMRLRRNTADNASVALLPQSLARLCVKRALKKQINQAVRGIANNIAATGTWPKFSSLSHAEQLPYLILATLMPAARQKSRNISSSQRLTVNTATSSHPDNPVNIETVHVLTGPMPVNKTAAHASVDHDHRWIVSGHWRQQPYGPNSSLRKRIWIAPYVQGPADKPLVVTDRVTRVQL